MTTIPYRLTTLAAALVIAGLPADGAAQARPPDLGQATLEELLGLEVTSAGRRQQRAEDVAAAVYVITQDDIRRSGLTILPEILRLAPGVQVSQVNANRWAVSVRGFNSIYSNKLLILLDGRSLYNFAFESVFWEAQDLDVSAIERIEIVRGPGDAMWGANAVNGVINIITQSAHLSRGGSATVSLGTFDSRATLRYGGALGRASYRVFGQWSGYSDGRTAAAGPAGDHWRSITSGYRLDWANATDTLMAQGHYTAGKNRPGHFEMESLVPFVVSTTGVSTTDEISVLARWSRTTADGSVVQAQGFTTHAWRDESIVYSVERTSDLDLQYEKPLPRQTLMLGAGYRYVDLAIESTPTLQVGSERNRRFSAFAEDEIALGQHVKLTLGGRIEHEQTRGWGLSPSGRVMWEASPRQRIWAAVARARRTPATTDRSLRINLFALEGPGLPILLAFTGSPEFGTETLTQVDAGYRVRIGSTASVDLAVFRGHYAGLPTAEPQPLVFETTPAPAHLLLALQMANLMNATTSGVELAVHWSPLDAWRLDASYAALRLRPSIDPTSLDEFAEFFDGDAPRYQWQARSTTWIGPRTQVTAALYHAGAYRQLEIPAYTRLDGHVQVTLRSGLTAAIVGRNLLTSLHEEFSPLFPLVAPSSIPRSARVQLRWQF